MGRLGFTASAPTAKCMWVLKGWSALYSITSANPEVHLATCVWTITADAMEAPHMAAGKKSPTGLSKLAAWAQWGSGIGQKGQGRACWRGWHQAWLTGARCCPLQSNPTCLLYLIGLLPAKELAQAQGDPLDVTGLWKRKYFPSKLPHQPQMNTGTHKNILAGSGQGAL